jgi:hypothetical protein
VPLLFFRRIGRAGSGELLRAHPFDLDAPDGLRVFRLQRLREAAHALAHLVHGLRLGFDRFELAGERFEPAMG